VRAQRQAGWQSQRFAQAEHLPSLVCPDQAIALQVAIFEIERYRLKQQRLASLLLHHRRPADADHWCLVANCTDFQQDGASLGGVASHNLKLAAAATRPVALVDRNACASQIQPLVPESSSMSPSVSKA